MKARNMKTAKMNTAENARIGTKIVKTAEMDAARRGRKVVELVIAKTAGKTEMAEIVPFRHEKYRHDWRGCFLNPYCRHFNPNTAEEFYNGQADGPNAFYRDVYEVYQNGLQTEGETFNQETEQEFQGHGPQGRGFQRGPRSGQGQWENGYSPQGEQENEGYHFDQPSRSAGWNNHANYNGCW